MHTPNKFIFQSSHLNEKIKKKIHEVLQIPNTWSVWRWHQSAKNMNYFRIMLRVIHSTLINYLNVNSILPAKESFGPPIRVFLDLIDDISSQLSLNIFKFFGASRNKVLYSHFLHWVWFKLLHLKLLSTKFKVLREKINYSNPSDKLLHHF